MEFRVVTLNLEQDHKRWSDRHPLISAEIAGLRPDVIALNEVCVPLQTARLLRDSAIAATGIPYKLVQQTRVNGLSNVEGEALLTRFAIVETGNLDYQADAYRRTGRNNPPEPARADRPDGSEVHSDYADSDRGDLRTRDASTARQQPWRAPDRDQSDAETGELTRSVLPQAKPMICRCASRSCYRHQNRQL